MNIKQVLENAIRILKKDNIDESILKAKVLLANILKESKYYLMVHETEELDDNLIKEYKEGIDKLSKNVPLQYITNKQEFMGLEFYVNENVLIPRSDTEILVEEVIDIAKKERKTKILDLCTGSGAIGISIAKNIQNCKMTLLDISKGALDVAKQNYINIVEASDPEKQIKIIQSDLFENLDDKNKFDIIVSNPPYIKRDVIKTLELQVQMEPILALDGGIDGLEIYRRIINEAYKYLKPNGYLCLEIGYDQKEKIIKLIELTGKYREIYSKKDLADNDRIIICNKKEN